MDMMNVRSDPRFMRRSWVPRRAFEPSPLGSAWKALGFVVSAAKLGGLRGAYSCTLVNVLDRRSAALRASARPTRCIVAPSATSFTVVVSFPPFRDLAAAIVTRTRRRRSTPSPE